MWKEEKVLKVWITKYALSSGIKEIEVNQSDSTLDTVIGESYRDFYHGEGKEWHRTYESALSRAEELRLKKIKSLKIKLKNWRKRGLYDYYLLRIYPVHIDGMG